MPQSNIEVLSLNYISTKFDTIKIKIINILVLLLEMHFLSWSFEAFLKKVLNCTQFFTNKCDSKPVVVIFQRHHSFKPVIFNRSRCQSFPRGCSWESFASGNGETCGRIEKGTNSPQNNLDREHRERSCTTEYRPPLGFLKGQDRTGWFCLVATAHGHALYVIILPSNDDDTYDREHRFKWPGCKYILVQ